MRWGWRAAAVGLMWLALALRLWQIGAPSLWFDEALEVQRAAGGAVAALFARGIDQDPPAYPLLLAAWLRLGTLDVWLRLPSAGLGVLAVAACAAWARRVGGVALGLSAGSLVAVAPVAVHYGQEVNQYAAVIALAALLGWLLERVLARDTAARWAALSAASVAAVATHYGLGFVLVAQAVALGRGAARRAPAARRLAVHLGLLAGVGLVLWWLGLSQSIQVAHLQSRFGGTDLAKEIGYIGDVGWREILVFFTVPYAGGPALFVARAVAALAALGALWLWGRGPTGRRAVLLGFLAPLALSYVASGLGWYPLGHRYALFALPAFLIAVAAGAEAVSRGRRAPCAGTILAVAVAFLAFAPQLDATNPWFAIPREDLRTVLRDVSGHVGPRDTVYVYHAAGPAFDAYGDMLAPAAAVRLGGRPMTPETAASEARRVAAAVAPGESVWLVFAHVAPRDHEALLQELVLGAAGRWEFAERVAAENAMAYRLERR